MSDLELPQALLPETVVHPTLQHEYSRRTRFAALVMATGMSAAALAGCDLDLPGNGGLNKDIQGQVIGEETEKKVGEHNADPRFRATSVSILDSEFLQGGGALEHDDSGGYNLVTVEHVARALYGLKPTVKSPDNLIEIDQEPERSDSPRINLPGVGILELGDADPEFIGDTGGDDAIDRFTTVHIGGDEANIIKEAEEKGVISIPEQAPLAGNFGDEFTMPLSETGAEMPFVLLSVSEDASKAELVPLYLLDQGLDYDKGMLNLTDLMTLIRDQEEREYPGIEISEDVLQSSAIIQLQQKLLDQVRAGTIAGTEAAKSLPCMGDSGSPFLNTSKDVIGVLSAGPAFYDYSPEQDSVAQYRISRDNDSPSMNRYCLSRVTISAPR